MAPGPRSKLLGRGRELSILDAVLDDIRSGRSRAVLVSGEPGLGKTALFEELMTHAGDCRILVATGMESEMELSAAGLHQLCSTQLDRIDTLPSPQREALLISFGMAEGAAPDRFLVGLAALTLLSDAAEERPLLCLIDDAQWLDQFSAQVLGFVARRLLAESVGLVFATRTAEHVEFAGFEQLVLEGLREQDARELLRTVLPGPIDPPVFDRMLAETRGNPLALLELPRDFTPAELAGGFGVRDPASLPMRIEATYVRRVERLPDEVQRLLLVAAAEPVGDPTLLWRAADRLGLPSGMALANAQDLLEVGSRVRFRHPLIRSAVYTVASDASRRRVHAALAECIAPDDDPDRRAWHRAHATAEPDEAVASELEVSADRARSRGGLAAAAALLERAVSLTPDPARRARRALSAAPIAHASGATDMALSLLATARSGPLDELEHARGALLEAQIAFSTRRGRDASALLMHAARRLEPLDVGLAHGAHLEAIWAAAFASHLAAAGNSLEVAAAARRAPPASDPPAPTDLMRDGLATRYVDGYEAGAPIMRRALAEFRRGDAFGLDDLSWVWLAVDLWDAEAWFELCTRAVQVARDAGALTILPLALHSLAAWYVPAGEFAVAESLLSEADSIIAATGDAPLTHGRLGLAALVGGDAEPLFEASVIDAETRGEGILARHADNAAAMFQLGLERFEDARRSAQRELDHNPAGFYMTALPELIEAAVRTDDRSLAEDALDRLREQTRASDTPWARSVEARSRGLVAESAATAETGFREAIDADGLGTFAVDRARALLLYGEWLSAHGRRREAVEQLRAAREAFVAMGAVPFAERAGRRLRALGQRVIRPQNETAVELTSQEAQIARLAREGHSNAEIGAQLFISSRTVEYHLAKVYSKLGIRSRKQLSATA